MPQDQDDIKGVDAMKQAPTPGPLSVELKACPFHHAGKSVVSVKQSGKFTFYVECYGGCRGPKETSESAAIREWNYRATPTPTAPVEASGSEREHAFGEFEGDHLTDGKGYATAEVYARCRAAFDAEWPNGRKAAYDAVLAALRPQPSGETREANNASAISTIYALTREPVTNLAAAAWNLASIQQICEDEQALPAPVASGGQHSSGEVDEEHGGKRDTWSDFESDHLTDGKGYATAETYRRCREAFDANWLKGRKAAYDAALAALKAEGK